MLPLAPPGSTFDFAWDIFRKFFKKRVGIDWEDREAMMKKHDLDGDERKIRGEDGARDDDFFDCFGPVVVKRQGDCGGEADVEAVGGMQRKPSVTMLRNVNELSHNDLTEAQAKTPEGGW
jgi:hypothetical protein